MKTALIAGSTGLIGSHVLQLVLDSNRYTQVIAITRQNTAVQYPKLLSLMVEFNKIAEALEGYTIHDVFCCLGTTMAKARSKEKFFEVDYKYPLLLAKTALSKGAQQFLMVSALGADKNSSLYYNQVKGEIEEAIAGVGFPTLHIFRPSLLLGHRSENRPGEDAAKFFYKFFGFLIPEKYKAIDATKVAKAMLHYAAHEQTGMFIHESRQLQQF